MRRNADRRDDRGPATARGSAAAFLTGVIALGLLLAGCGGGSSTGGVASLGSSHASKASTTSSTTSGSAADSSGGEPSPGSQAVAYAACMRSHGVPNFPDPKISRSGGGVSVKMAVPVQIGGNPSFKSADQACRKLLPGGGPGQQTVVSPAEQAQYLKAAACIRAHGVPSFPDPTFSGGGVHLDKRGLDMSSQAFKAAVRACESLIPGGAGGNGQARSGSTRQAAP